jgi:hypothetical protein
MYDYGIGGQERKTAISEGISDIPQNRTLLIERLTHEAPLAPQIVPDMRTLNDVFSFFKPAKEVVFETENGAPKTEELRFAGLADFGKMGITRQSTYLNELTHQCEDLQKFVKQLKTNKILKTLLENKDAKSAYMSCVQALMNELD